MRLLQTFFIFLISCLCFSQLQAQLSTSLLSDRLNFNENGNTESLLRFDGSNLFLDNNDRSGDLFLQSNNTLKLDGIEDVIVLGREQIYLATGAGLGITRLFINESGRVGIGTTAPNASLHVNNSNDPAMVVGSGAGTLAYLTVNKPAAASDAITRFRDNGTTIMRVNPASFTYEVDINGAGRITSGTWSASDKRLKQNIRTLKGAMSDIQKLRPTTYQFDTKSSKYQYLNLSDELQFGLIAQEVAEVFPNLVRQSEELDEEGQSRGFDLYAVNYTALIPVMIAGMQEQQMVIETQIKERQELEIQVENLEQRLATLEQLILESRSETPSTSTSTPATLEQNRPNPSSTQTTIAYTIPNTVQSAVLQIVNRSGQVIQQHIIDERGVGQFNLSTANFADGTYFYTLALDGQISQTKQMVVAKH